MFTYLCITVKCESGYWAFNKEQGADAGRRLLDYCVPQNIVDISTLHSRHKKWFYSLHVRRVGQSRTRASVSCTVYSVQYTVQWGTSWGKGHLLLHQVVLDDAN